MPVRPFRASARLSIPLLVATGLAAVACQALVVGTPEPSPSADLTHRFSLVGAGPVMDPRELGADYLLPGAAVIHEGTIHLFPVAFASNSPGPRALHLSSTDGRTWTGDGSASVLEDFALELDENGAIPSSLFVAADGTWVMHGSGRRPGGDDPLVWRATAPSADGPWTAHPEPVLAPDIESWDTLVTDHPSVVHADDGFLMAYGGASAAAPHWHRIGIARSTDGLAWTRMSAHLPGADDGLALGPSACGIDGRAMADPHLLRTDAGYRLLVGVMLNGETDAMEIIVAESEDATDWTCADHEPFGSGHLHGAPSLHSFVAFDHDGATHILVEVLGEASSTIWLAHYDG